MIEALIAGETNPAELASLANRWVKASQEELREALRGRVTKNHRFLLRLHLNQVDALDAAVATVDTQVEGILGPFRTAVEQVMSVPGIKNLSAQVIISEIGTEIAGDPPEESAMRVAVAPQRLPTNSVNARASKATFDLNQLMSCGSA